MTNLYFKYKLNRKMNSMVGRIKVKKIEKGSIILLACFDSV